MYSAKIKILTFLTLIDDNGVFVLRIMTQYIILHRRFIPWV